MKQLSVKQLANNLKNKKAKVAKLAQELKNEKATVIMLKKSFIEAKNLEAAAKEVKPKVNIKAKAKTKKK